MPSDAQKKRGWILPNSIEGHPLICVTMLIPDVLEYRAAFRGAVQELGKWWNWERSGEPNDRRATQAAAYWRRLIYDHYKIGDCSNNLPDCYRIPLDDPRIEWLPNDPFRTPNLIPDGYIFPPWYIAPQVNVIGASAGDVCTDMSRITAIFGWHLQYSVPRFRLSLAGSGVVRLHFVNVLQGGLASIQVDADLLQLQFLDLWKDVTSIPPETSQVIVIELVLNADVEHIIDVQMLPRVDDSIFPLGFGGGIRRIEVCGFGNKCPGCPDCPGSEDDCGCDEDIIIDDCGCE